MLRFIDRLDSRVVIYDYLRTIAIVLVIIGHCDYINVNSPYGTFNFQLHEMAYSMTYTCAIQRHIYSFHMPLFVILSGCAYSLTIINKWGGVLPNNFMINKARRLLVPFVLVAILWTIPLKYIAGFWDGSGEQIYEHIFLGHIIMLKDCRSHLWFLPTLFLIFCYVAIIEKLKLRQKPILFFAGLLIAYHFRYLLGFHLLLPWSLQYLLWFYVGVYFEMNRVEINAWLDRSKNAYIAIMILITAFCINHGMMSVINGYWRTGYFVNIFAICFCLYIICHLMVRRNVMRGMFSKISCRSYDLYLYSDPVNYLIIGLIGSYLSFDFLSDDIGVIGLFLFRIVVTFAVAWAMSMLVPYIKKSFLSLIATH